MNDVASEIPVLQVNGLVKHFGVTRGLIRNQVIGLVRAVEDVSFDIARGETLALVGDFGDDAEIMGDNEDRHAEPPLQVA